MFLTLFFSHWILFGFWFLIVTRFPDPEKKNQKPKRKKNTHNTEKQNVQLQRSCEFRSESVCHGIFWCIWHVSKHESVGILDQHRTILTKPKSCTGAVCASTNEYVASASFASYVWFGGMYSRTQLCNLQLLSVREVSVYVGSLDRPKQFPHKHFIFCLCEQKTKLPPEPQKTTKKKINSARRTNGNRTFAKISRMDAEPRLSICDFHDRSPQCIHQRAETRRISCRWH